MSLPQFFLDDQILGDETATAFRLRLNADDVRHARVLRLAPGEHVAAVDAVSDYFELELLSFDEGLPVVRICEHGTAACPAPQVTLVQGLAKGDKMDAVVRHATELGVQAFFPFTCERSVVRLDEKKAVSRAARWRSIARSAAMQSGQRRVPEVAVPEPLASVCERLADFDCVLVCWEGAGGEDRLSAAIEKMLTGSGKAVTELRVAVVVGPEGGLSRREVDALLDGAPGACFVSLGRSILRTETAGVVAPALVLFCLGELGGPLRP